MEFSLLKEEMSENSGNVKKKFGIKNPSMVTCCIGLTIGFFVSFIFCLIIILTSFAFMHQSNSQVQRIVSVDGQWSEWINGSCSVTCGIGLITRVRACSKPSPTNGGKYCDGPSMERVDCLLSAECPVSGQQTVGFYAISTRDLDLAIDQTITFDHIYTNVGSGYNSTSGQFIAPISGLYRIGNTAMSQSGHAVFLKMMKNGVEVGRSTGQMGYQTADMEAILTLKKGDAIDIRRRTNSGKTTERLHGNRLASFTGFLIAKI